MRKLVPDRQGLENSLPQQLGMGKIHPRPTGDVNNLIPDSQGWVPSHPRPPGIGQI